jgi:hypothetical protein
LNPTPSWPLEQPRESCQVRETCRLALIIALGSSGRLPTSRTVFGRGSPRCASVNADTLDDGRGGAEEALDLGPSIGPACASSRAVSSNSRAGGEVR